MNFQPAIYEHAAGLINRSPWDVSRDLNLLVQAHSTAYKLYHHTPISVGIDIYNLEAEAYGADIVKPNADAVPSVTHPFKTIPKLLDLDTESLVANGRIDLMLTAGRELSKQYPDAVVKIPVSGPFSLATNLVSADVFLMEAVKNPSLGRDVLAHLAMGQINFCQAIHKAGLQPVIFESAATPPLISPKMFSDLERPALELLMDRAGKLFSSPQALIIGGDTFPVLGEMLKCSPSYLICPFETDQNKFMEMMKDYPEVMVRLNMAPQVFIGNDENRAFLEADRILKIAGNRENVCIGSGALAFEANPELVLAVKKYIESF